MYIRELTRLTHNNISGLRSALNACLVTYKYVLAATIIVFLIAAYIIQRHIISACQVGTLLTINKGADSIMTDDELQQQAATIKSTALISQVVNAPAFRYSYVHEGSVTSLIKRYERNLKIKKANSANTLSIEFKDETQLRAQAFLNFLIAQYQLNIIDNNAIGQSIKTMDDSLEILQKDMSSIHRSDIDPSLRNDLNKNPAITLQNRQEYKRQASVLDVIYSYINKPVSSFVVVPDSYLPDTDQLQPLVKQYNELQQRRQSLLNYETGADKTTAKLVNLQMISLQWQINKLIASQKSFITKQLNLPNTAQPRAVGKAKTRNLQRHIDSLSNLKSDAMVLQLKTAPRVSATRYTIKPIHPHSPWAYASAVLIGIAASVVAIYASQKLSKNINSLADIKALTNITIAGELEDTSADNSGKQPCSIAPQTHISLLLERYMVKGRKLVLVTSSMSDEGKGYFSINLAHELASAGKKVVLIDYTIEGPNLLDKLDITYNKGVNDYLASSNVTIADLITPAADCDNLYFIGAGVAWEHLKLELKSFLSQLAMAPSDDSPEREHQQKSDEKLTALVLELEQQFDYIIMYTPDIDSRTDSHCIASLSGLCVCLVRYNYTLKEQVTKLNDLNNSGHLQNAIIVVNHFLKCELPLTSINH